MCMYDVDGRALLKKFPPSKSKRWTGRSSAWILIGSTRPHGFIAASRSGDDEGPRRGDRGRAPSAGRRATSRTGRWAADLLIARID